MKLSATVSFPCSSVSKEYACSAGDLGSIPGSGRSPGEGNGSPLQYSCLENPMGREAWRATVHGVATVGYDLATKPAPPPSLANNHFTLLYIFFLTIRILKTYLYFLINLKIHNIFI